MYWQGQWVTCIDNRLCVHVCYHMIHHFVFLMEGYACGPEGFGSRGLTVKSKVHVVLESCWEEDGY